MTGNENKYHDLRPRSQRKDEKISETFTFVFIIVFNAMKLLFKTFIIKLVGQINVLKGMAPFLCDFPYSKYDIR